MGERSISTALQGGNTGAAKRVLTQLMQSDIIAPLLVASSSAQRSAHTQESLLRLQLQKLRYQLAAFERNRTQAPDSNQVASPRALDTLLPDSLLDDGTPQPLALHSTGLQPVPADVAAAQLWQSLHLCMQPEAPLLHAIATPDSGSSSSAGGGSAATALAAGVHQLAVWSAAVGDASVPRWLPALRNTLLAPTLQAWRTEQLRGAAAASGPDAKAHVGDVTDWDALLADEAAHSAPLLTELAAASVSTGAQQQRAWLAFGDCLYSRVRRARHTRRTAATTQDARKTKTPLTPSDELCYRHVTLACARALALDCNAAGSTDTTRILLRLLHLAIHHNTDAMAPAIAAALDMVPPAAWEVLAPQLFVQLQHSQQHVRAYATQILAGLAKPVPASVLYAAVAAAAQQGEPSDELSALLAAVAGGHRDRVAQCRALVDGLRLLTPLAAESWQSTLRAAIVEIRRRSASLRAEAARAPPGGEATEGLWQRRYHAMVAHGLSRLKHLHQVPFLTCQQRLACMILYKST